MEVSKIKNSVCILIGKRYHLKKKENDRIGAFWTPNLEMAMLYLYSALTGSNLNDYEILCTLNVL